MLNQGLSEDDEIGCFPFPTNMISLPLDSSNQTLLTPSHQHPQRHKPQQNLPSEYEGTHILPLQTSTANYWAWGEVISNRILEMNSRDDHGLGIKMNKFKSRRKVREPRFCFKTMSDVDVLDDGYKWRKYGQKVVKNTQHPSNLTFFGAFSLVVPIHGSDAYLGRLPQK